MIKPESEGRTFWVGGEIWRAGREGLMNELTAEQTPLTGMDWGMVLPLWALLPREGEGEVEAA